MLTPTTTTTITTIIPSLPQPSQAASRRSIELAGVTREQLALANIAASSYYSRDTPAFLYTEHLRDGALSGLALLSPPSIFAFSQHLYYI